ncbi:MAG: hypothetical protein N4A33_06220 [Bacteriovoracaceae bacterium]|nr:hypothetical protein [Bacteriovoracaceae bacterium]
MKKLLLLTTLFSTLAFADATGGGNGGDAIVCGNNIYMLDYIEAYGDTVEYEYKDDISKIVDQMVSKLEKRDEFLYISVKETSSRFLRGIYEYEQSGQVSTSTVEFTDKELLNIIDEGFYSIPEHCSLEQLIVRRDTDSIVKKEFLVKRKIWDRMSNYQKAVAVIHEALYLYMLDAQQSNSFLARSFNKLMLTGDLYRMNDMEYIKLMVEYNIIQPFARNGIQVKEIEIFNCLKNTRVIRTINERALKRLKQYFRSYDRIECEFYENGNLKGIKSRYSYNSSLFTNNEINLSYVKLAKNIPIKMVAFNNDKEVSLIKGKFLDDILSQNSFPNSIAIKKNRLFRRIEAEGNTICEGASNRCWSNFRVDKENLNTNIYNLHGKSIFFAYVSLRKNRYTVHGVTKLQRRVLSKMFVRKLTDKKSKYYDFSFDENHNLIFEK